MKERKKRKKSIFSRLVKSYVLFLTLSVVLYLGVVVLFLTLVGNGNARNIYPKAIVEKDGSIKNLEALKNVGGWIEELNEDGTVIKVYGERKQERNQYSLKELAKFLELGMMDYDQYGVMFRTNDLGEQKEYVACVRCVGEPQRIFLVIYPAGIPTYQFTIDVDKAGGSWIFFALLALFFIEVLAISFYLKRHIEKPLRHLTEGMDEVSKGERDIVLDDNVDKEFAEICDKFNRMAKKLKESEDEKRRMEQRRNQMLLELAHDIKNPVASIKSSIGALKEGLVAQEKISDYYGTIDAKAERIKALTEDMSTSLKLESDSYQLNLKERDVCETVRRICAEFYEEITATGKEFEIEIPEEPCMERIDEKLFGRVIGNLLSNANKYNETGKNIVLRLMRKEGQTLIEVLDDGTAIDEEFVPRMFEEFSRGDETRKTDGGTGLGLAIARKIMEKHHGTLKYARKDGMNCFSVSFQK